MDRPTFKSESAQRFARRRMLKMDNSKRENNWDLPVFIHASGPGSISKWWNIVQGHQKLVKILKERLNRLSYFFFTKQGLAILQRGVGEGICPNQSSKVQLPEGLSRGGCWSFDLIDAQEGNSKRVNNWNLPVSINALGPHSIRKWGNIARGHQTLVRSSQERLNRLSFFYILLSKA